MMKKQDSNDQLRDDWDVITSTMDGGVVWKRYRDGKIVVTKAGETPQEVLAREQGGTAEN